MLLSILDLTPVLKEVHIKKNKQRKRSERTTTDSTFEAHVDTEVGTTVDSDNEPTPNLCHIEVEIGTKTGSSTTVNPKLPGSTGKKIKKRTNKDDQRETQNPFLNFGRSPANTMRKSIQRKRVILNILIDFRAKMFPFILSTNVFQEFLSDLESTVENKLNYRLQFFL